MPINSRKLYSNGTYIVHVIFNIIGVLIWIGFIPWFADIVRWLSPVSSELSGTAQMVVDVPRQIANANTLFNVSNTIIFFAFIGLLARIVEYIVPSPTVIEADTGKAVYLDEIYLTQPAMALDQSKREICRLGTHVIGMSRQATHAALNGNYEVLRQLQEEEEHADSLYNEIVTYLTSLSTQDLVESQAKTIQTYMGVVNYLENTADIIETGFVPAGIQRLEANWIPAEEVTEHLLVLDKLAITALKDAIHAFAENDQQMAKNVSLTKQSFNVKADEIRLLLIQHVSRTGKKGVKEYHYILGVLENIKRLHTLARRVADFV